MDVAAEWMVKGQAGELPEVDEAARFTALVERYSQLMYRVAASLLRNRHDAEDAVQEALLRLYRTGGWERMANERAFLARTAWHAALDRLPRRERREQEELDETALAAAGPSPEALLAEGDERELLRQMIDALPEPLRRPLVLSAIEEMSSVEVAAVLGIPEGTVRTRVMRAKAELRKRWVAVREVRG